MGADDDDNLDDALPTTIDPGVPTGARERPAKFDPLARVKDNRAAAGPGAHPVAAEVIAALKPVRHDDPMPPKPRPPSSFDPSGRIDDSSRTAKWAPRDLEAPTRGDGRAKSPTKRGHDGPASSPPRDRSEPMRVISMKTPADLGSEDRAQRVLPVVQLRAISNAHQTPARGMGNLAPPRDPREVRSRRVRDNVIWGSLAVILASVVTLAIWFLARR